MNNAYIYINLNEEVFYYFTALASSGCDIFSSFAYFFNCNQMCNSLDDLPLVLNGIPEDGRGGLNM